MTGAREELVRELRDARSELARVVAALERGVAPARARERGLDASIETLAARIAAQAGAPLEAGARRECAALLDLVGVARKLASAQMERAQTELADVRAVRARLGRQRERLEQLTARNCDVSA